MSHPETLDAGSPNFGVSEIHSRMASFGPISSLNRSQKPRVSIRAIPEQRISLLSVFSSQIIDCRWPCLPKLKGNPLANVFQAHMHIMQRLTILPFKHRGAGKQLTFMLAKFCKPQLGTETTYTFYWAWDPLPCEENPVSQIVTPPALPQAFSEVLDETFYESDNVLSAILNHGLSYNTCALLAAPFMQNSHHLQL